MPPPLCKGSPAPSSCSSRPEVTRSSPSTRRRYPSCTCWPTARPWDRWALGNICSPTKPVCFRPRFRPALSRLSPAWRRGCEACLSRVPSPCRWAWAPSATASVWLTGAATWVPTTRSQPAASTGDARRGRTNSTWGCRRPPPSLPPPRGFVSDIGEDFPNRKPTVERIQLRS